MIGLIHVMVHYQLISPSYGGLLAWVWSSLAAKLKAPWLVTGWLGSQRRGHFLSYPSFRWPYWRPSWPPLAGFQPVRRTALSSGYWIRWRCYMDRTDSTRWPHAPTTRYPGPNFLERGRDTDIPRRYQGPGATCLWLCPGVSREPRRHLVRFYGENGWQTFRLEWRQHGTAIPGDGATGGCVSRAWEASTTVEWLSVTASSSGQSGNRRRPDRSQ